MNTTTSVIGNQSDFIFDDISSIEVNGIVYDNIIIKESSNLVTLHSPFGKIVTSKVSINTNQYYTILFNNNHITKDNIVSVMTGGFTGNGILFSEIKYQRDGSVNILLKNESDQILRGQLNIYFFIT